MKKRKILSSIAKYAVVCILALIVVFPFLLILLISLKSKAEFGISPMGIPKVWTLDNFITVYKVGKIPLAMFNSLFITCLAIFLQIIMGSLAAYALTKMRFKQSKTFSAAFLAPMIFPMTTVIIPLYMLFKQIGLSNSLWGLVIIHTASGLSMVIFILTSFMGTIPIQISEAATVDGASHIRAYRQIIMPLVKPAVATTTIISGLSIWNDFFLPLIMITDPKKSTLPLKIFVFQSQYSDEWTKICACVVFLVVPILIAYVALQRQIISGVVAGSVKG